MLEVASVLEAGCETSLETELNLDCAALTEVAFGRENGAER